MLRTRGTRRDRRRRRQTTVNAAQRSMRAVWRYHTQRNLRARASRAWDQYQLRFWTMAASVWRLYCRLWSLYLPSMQFLTCTLSISRTRVTNGDRRHIAKRASRLTTATGAAWAGGRAFTYRRATIWQRVPATPRRGQLRGGDVGGRPPADTLIPHRDANLNALPQRATRQGRIVAALHISAAAASPAPHHFRGCLLLLQHISSALNALEDGRTLFVQKTTDTGGRAAEEHNTVQGTGMPDLLPRYYHHHLPAAHMVSSASL